MSRTLDCTNNSVLEIYQTCGKGKDWLSHKCFRIENMSDKIPSRRTPLDIPVVKQADVSLPPFIQIEFLLIMRELFCCVG